MVDNQITAIGNLLLLPGLEEQTVIDINQALRTMVAPYIRAKPPDEQGAGIDPFSEARQAVDAMLGAGVFAEWMEGKVTANGRSKG